MQYGFDPAPVSDLEVTLIGNHLADGSVYHKYLVTALEIQINYDFRLREKTSKLT